jgi:hypothetical protein
VYICAVPTVCHVPHYRPPICQGLWSAVSKFCYHESVRHSVQLSTGDRPVTERKTKENARHIYVPRGGLKLLVPVLEK